MIFLRRPCQEDGGASLISTVGGPSATAQHNDACGVGSMGSVSSSTIEAQLLVSGETLEASVAKLAAGAEQVERRLPPEKAELRQQLAELRKGNVTLMAEIEKMRLTKQRAQLLAEPECAKAEAAAPIGMSARLLSSERPLSPSSLRELPPPPLLGSADVAGGLSGFERSAFTYSQNDSSQLLQSFCSSLVDDDMSYITRHIS